MQLMHINCIGKLQHNCSRCNLCILTVLVNLNIIVLDAICILTVFVNFNIIVLDATYVY